MIMLSTNDPSALTSLGRRTRGLALRLAVALSMPCLLASCGAAGSGAGLAPPPATFPIGLSDHSLAVSGVVRRFRVHVPPTLTDGPRAIVLVLHGGGGTGLDVANTGAHPLSVFRTVADRERFVVVYPGGLPATDGSAGWVDCRADNGVSSGADDVGFLVALIDRVRNAYGLPRSRVFMAGSSNGAMMTHAFAMAQPDHVGAVATASGSIAANPRSGPCSTGPAAPVPIVLVHGTADPQMPFDGGCVANLGGACNRGRVVSAEETRNRWLTANGLAGATPSTQVVEIAADDAGPAQRFDYTGAVPVQWWRLDGAGHSPPSRTVLVAPSTVSGIQNRDIEFAEVAWAFFAARLP